MAKTTYKTILCSIFSAHWIISSCWECWLVAEINICYGSMDEVIVVGALCLKCKMWIMNVIQCPIKCLESNNCDDDIWILEGRLQWREWIQFYRDHLLEIYVNTYNSQLFNMQSLDLDDLMINSRHWIRKLRHLMRC